MHKLRALAFVLAVTACGDDGGSARVDAPVLIDSKGADATVDGPAIDAMIDAPLIDAPVGPSPRVWSIGDLVTDNRREAGAFLDGAALPFTTASPPPTRAPGGATAELFDGSGSTDFVFDAKGGKIAYVANATDMARYDLFVANADGSGATMLVQGQTGVEITSISLSPDGTKVAFVADTVALNSGYDLFVVPAAGGTPVQVTPARATVATPADLDVFVQVEWSANSQYLAFTGDFTENAFDQVYVVDTNAASPAAVELLARADIATQVMGAQGSRGKPVFDSANNVYFRARVSTANNSVFTLFKATVTGTRTAITLPTRTDASVPDAGAFGVTPDGTKLVFSADAPTATVYNLYAVATTNPQTPVNLTNLTTALTAGTIRANFTTPLYFSPDGSKVAAVANFSSTDAALTRLEPFVVKVDGSGSRRLFNIPTACGNCDSGAIAWAGNGAVYVLGDIAIDNDTALFRFDADMTDQTATPAVTPPTGGDLINVISVQP